MLPLPPVLLREMPPEVPHAQTVTLADGEVEFSVHLPPSWKPKAREDLTIHFHTSERVSIPAHRRSGLEGPLITLNRPGLSSAYRVPFEDTGRLRRVMNLTAGYLKQKGAPEQMEWANLDISSFSAGYGAVREIVKLPWAFRLIRRVVLADSLYGSLDPDSERRQPTQATIAAWLPLAEAAARGEKTFLITTSEVPTPYASSSECSAAIARHVGGNLTPGPPDPPDLGELSQYRLRDRFDKGRLHLWHYEGSDGASHVAHVWNLGALWRSLDRAEPAERTIEERRR